MRDFSNALLEGYGNLHEWIDRPDEPVSLEIAIGDKILVGEEHTIGDYFTADEAVKMIVKKISEITTEQDFRNFRADSFDYDDDQDPGDVYIEVITDKELLELYGDRSIRFSLDRLFDAPTDSIYILNKLFSNASSKHEELVLDALMKKASELGINGITGKKYSC